jgi:hypothetical protein
MSPQPILAPLSAQAPISRAPPDDLRFLFGVRFDGKSLLAPLTKLGSPASGQ